MYERRIGRLVGTNESDEEKGRRKENCVAAGSSVLSSLAPSHDSIIRETTSTERPGWLPVTPVS